MRNSHLKSRRLSASAACLALSLFAYEASATLVYWDPEGVSSTTTPNGNWEDVAWAPTTNQTASLANFTEGVAAAFAAGTTATGAYTVNVNANHSIAGIFNGGLNDATSADVLITGPGILSIVSGPQGFWTASGGNTTILSQLSGTGQLENESSGSLYLYASNSYTGGTLLGTSAGLNFNNNNSFGTGAITWGVTTSVLATPANDGHGHTGATGPITLPNAVVPISGTQIFAGLSTVPVTFAGNWTLPSAGTVTFQHQLATGGSGTPLVNISGIISGGASFVKTGIGTLVLSGANTFSAGTTINAGTVAVTADNNLGKVPTSPTLSVTLGGGTLNFSNTFTLNANRQILVASNSTIGVSSGKTLTFGGVISGTANVTKNGAGTLLLTGNNGYGGTTTISAGTLEADSQSGSATGTNTVTINSGTTLDGSGIVSGPVTGTGNIQAGTASAAGNLTLGNGLNLSGGGTYVWNLFSNNTAGNFSTITLIGGNLALGGTSKMSLNFKGTATAPSVTNAFWQTQEAWTVVPVTGAAGNTGNTKFTTLVNGTYPAGNFTNYVFGNGNIVLLYQPNFPVFDTLYDAGPGFFSGENLILTNFSGLSLGVWASTNGYLAVSNWTLVGTMQEQPLAPALPGYSRYAINVNPTVSPTYYVAGNMNTGPYILSPVPAAILTTADFATFNLTTTNVTISTNGVLALLPPPPVVLPGSAYSSSGFQLQFSASTNQNYTVQASTDLINWTNISTGTVTVSPVSITDTNATNFTQRFYRILTQ